MKFNLPFLAFPHGLVMYPTDLKIIANKLEIAGGFTLGKQLDGKDDSQKPITQTRNRTSCWFIGVSS